jgi:hypothetical protein
MVEWILVDLLAVGRASCGTLLALQAIGLEISKSQHRSQQQQQQQQTRSASKFIT